MSLTAAFNNAASGLTVALRAAGVTSSNLANALSDGYARRDIRIETRRDGGAVVTGVNRPVDQRILTQLRLSNATTSGLSTTVDQLTEIERLWGSSDEPGSLYALTTRFEVSLQSLATHQASPTRLNAVHASAQALAGKITGIAKGLQQARQDADKQIASEVSSLNGHLATIAKLNTALVSSKDESTASMQDQRQALIDKVSKLIPIRQITRPHGSIALVTTKGQFLLDELPYDISFSTSGLITADKSVENGTLDTPGINGAPLNLPDGGRLAALLRLRDETAPQNLQKLNTLADHLVESTFNPQASTQLFAAQSPDHPAASLVANQAPVDATHVLDGLTTKTDHPFGRSEFAQHAFELSTDLSQQILLNEDALAAAQATHATLQESFGGSGVDTDTELQTLLRIEKTYAANAKALQAITGMLDDLLTIG
jgi:flagellar hook-associated protein 1 FlgK